MLQRARIPVLRELRNPPLSSEDTLRGIPLGPEISGVSLRLNFLLAQPTFTRTAHIQELYQDPSIRTISQLHQEAEFLDVKVFSGKRHETLVLSFYR